MTAGETATFECELSYEGIAVAWFLGGQRMEAGERVSEESFSVPFQTLQSFYVKHGERSGSQEQQRGERDEHMNLSTEGRKEQSEKFYLWFRCSASQC